MTLNTAIAIYDPLVPRRLHEFTNTLIAPGLDVAWDEAPSVYDPHTMRLDNRPGQGLLGLVVAIAYGIDGPYETEESARAEWEEWADPDDPDETFTWPHPGPVLIRWSIDTGYGWRGPNGSGCSDLHAWVVSEVGVWLDDQSIRWQWQNEFTGEWHKGVESVSDLGDPERGRL